MKISPIQVLASVSFIAMLACAAPMAAYANGESVPADFSQAQQKEPPMKKGAASAQTGTVQASRLTLMEALRAAYLTNPALKAARESFKAVQEEVPQARSNWFPSIEAGADVTSMNIEGAAAGAAEGTTSKQLEGTVTQPLYRGGRTVAAVSSAESLVIASQSLLTGTEQNLISDAAAAYMDVFRDKALLDLSENNKAVIARQLEASRNRFEVGEVTRTDVSQSEARLARAESGVIKARGDLQRSKAVFEQIVGMPPGELEEPKFSFPLPTTLDEALAVAGKSNPDLIAAESLHRSAQDDARGIFGERLPEVSLFGSLDKEYDPQPGLLDDQTTSAVGVRASVPIFTGGLITSRVRQAKQTANQRYMEILDTKNSVRQQVISSWENLMTAKAEIRSRRAQVEAASVAREGVHQEEQLGTRTILDTLDADQEYLDAQVALVSAKRNEVVATYQLAAILGLLTPQAIGITGISPE